MCCTPRFLNIFSTIWEHILYVTDDPLNGLPCLPTCPSLPLTRELQREQVLLQRLDLDQLGAARADGVAPAAGREPVPGNGRFQRL